jgi:hypothetical protein
MRDDSYQRDGIDDHITLRPRDDLFRPMARITCDEAHELLAGQIGDYFPAEAQHADWYASDDDAHLATVMPNGQLWRFVLLRRGENGVYNRLAAGERPSRERAFDALIRQG